MSSRWMRNSFVYLLIIVAVIAIFFTLFSEPLGSIFLMKATKFYRITLTQASEPYNIPAGFQ